MDYCAFDLDPEKRNSVFYLMREGKRKRQRKKWLAGVAQLLHEELAMCDFVVKSFRETGSDGDFYLTVFPTHEPLQLRRTQLCTVTAAGFLYSAAAKWGKKPKRFDVLLAEES